MVAAPGSQGPVEDAPANPTEDKDGQEEFEEDRAEEEESGPKDCAAWYDGETEEEQQREQDKDVYRDDDLDGDGCIGDKPVPEEDKVPTKTDEECARQLENESEEKRNEEIDEDVANGTDSDGDGCVGEKEAGNATGPGGAPAATNVNNDPSDDPGGFPGMAVGAFKAILEWLYGVTVEKPSEEMNTLLTEEAFQMPEVDAAGIGGFYDKTSDLVKPGAVLVMLYLGYLMMFQGASYNANVAVQNVLPKIFIFFAMIGFLPDLLRMVSDLTSALSQTFVTQNGLEAFLSGEGSVGSQGAEDQGFMVVLANTAAFIMMILVLFMCGIKNIVFTQLYILAPLALLCWAVPQLSSVAAMWARGITACLILPLLFAAEFAIGGLMINNPGSVFGPGLGNDSVLTAPVIAIVVLYVVWRTPKHLLSWVLSGQSASPGMVSQVVRAVVIRRIA